MLKSFPAMDNLWDTFMILASSSKCHNNSNIKEMCLQFLLLISGYVLFPLSATPRQVKISFLFEKESAFLTSK